MSKQCANYNSHASFFNFCYLLNWYPWVKTLAGLELYDISGICVSTGHIETNFIHVSNNNKNQDCFLNDFLYLQND